jgi:hypothetical protein
MARSRTDIGLYDTLIESYRAVGLLPAWTGKAKSALSGASGFKASL